MESGIKRVFNTAGKAEYLEALESCKGLDGVTYINICLASGTAHHTFWHNRQDVKVIQKVINQVKYRTPAKAFK